MHKRPLQGPTGAWGAEQEDMRQNAAEVQGIDAWVSALPELEDAGELGDQGLVGPVPAHHAHLGRQLLTRIQSIAEPHVSRGCLSVHCAQLLAVALLQQRSYVHLFRHGAPCVANRAASQTGLTRAKDWKPFLLGSFKQYAKKPRTSLLPAPGVLSRIASEASPQVCCRASGRSCMATATSVLAKAQAKC